MLDVARIEVRRSLDVARTEVEGARWTRHARGARQRRGGRAYPEVKRSGARISNIKTKDYRVHRSRTYILISNIGRGPEW